MNYDQICGALLFTVHCPLTAKNSIFSPPPLPQPTHKQRVSFTVGEKMQLLFSQNWPLRTRNKSVNHIGINNITNQQGQTKGETKAREFREYPGFWPVAADVGHHEPKRPCSLIPVPCLYLSPGGNLQQSPAASGSFAPASSATFHCPSACFFQTVM
jgi:hypothetical protein